MTATSTARRWLAAGLLALGAATLAAAPGGRRRAPATRAPVRSLGTRAPRAPRASTSPWALPSAGSP